MNFWWHVAMKSPWRSQVTHHLFRTHSNLVFVVSQLLQQVYNGSFKGNYGVYSGILGSEWDKYGMEVSVWLLSWII